LGGREYVPTESAIGKAMVAGPRKAAPAPWLDDVIDANGEIVRSCAKAAVPSRRFKLLRGPGVLSLSVM
jgi:hypothetical protein